MKPTRKITLPILSSLVISAGAAFAKDNFQEGDLALAFYQLVGGVVQNQTYVVNLGPAKLYRENTQNNVPVSTVNPAIASSNIASDLSNTFGAQWAESGTVYWMVIGGVSAGTTSGTEGDSYFPGTPPVDGDPGRTTYFSKARNSLNAAATAKGTTVSTTLSQTNRGTFSTNMASFLKGCSWGIDGYQTNTSTSATNLAGAVLPTTNAATVDEFLPPVVNTYFGVSVAFDPRQLLGVGLISGTANVEGALDMYRMIHTTTDADLTVGASSGNAVVGTAQFIGTLSLAANGDLKISGISSAGNFNSWATTNGVTGGANGDSDKDGISNLVEYALNLNPAASDGSPGTFTTGGLISFSKRAEAVTNGDVTYVIQESDDLGLSDPWQAVTPTSNTSSIISYQLPAGSPKKFARLVVTQTP